MALLEALPKGSKIMVGAFSGDKRIVLAPTTDPAAVAGSFQVFKAGTTGVALPDGLFDMVEYLASCDAEARSLLLVSAGRVREGDLQFEDPLNAAMARHIPIFALAVGPGEGKLLRRIAKITGGEYVRMEVADAATLAHSLNPASRAAGEGGPTAEASPSPKTGSSTSTGLLGAAAVFFSLGGLLMLGVVFLLIRKMSAATPPKPAAPGVAAVPPPRTAPRRPVVKAKAEEPIYHEDEEILEKTLVVNPTPTLRALSGPGAGKNFPLSAAGPTSLGRARHNDIMVPEEGASAQHCRIDREGDSYVLHDLGSTNGTWVNGKRTERAVLQHGDRVRVGQTVFTVSLFGDRT